MRSGQLPVISTQSQTPIQSPAGRRRRRYAIRMWRRYALSVKLAVTVVTSAEGKQLRPRARGTPGSDLFGHFHSPVSAFGDQRRRSPRGVASLR
ncbi:hypothetical protein JTB14_005382 [Gonioctena quinquepunctata]|nr:hypothetical protein JTB14_005382 [Gonioctena quinquepunctata]